MSGAPPVDVVLSFDYELFHGRNLASHDEVLFEPTERILARLESLEGFDAAAIEQGLKALVAERGVKVGQLVHPLRFAVTGRTVGLGLYDALAILGRERSLARIRRAASAAA